MSRVTRPIDKRRWYTLTLESRRAAIEDLADRARDTFGIEPVQLSKPGVERAWLDLYFQNRHDALRAGRTASNWPDVRGCALREVTPRDWTAFWRRHFKPLSVGERLWVRPVWDQRRPKHKNRRIVCIEPGLSFGTGDHFTTRFCLEAIERLCRESPPASLLDAGCGSGILAIAAAKMGIRRVLALDHDPQAVAQAKINVRRNRVGHRIRIRRCDLLAHPPRARFDVICANLYGDLLRAIAPVFCRSARHRIVLSGIREPEADSVAETFLRYGAREIERDGNGEWCGLIFTLRLPTRADRD